MSAVDGQERDGTCVYIEFRGECPCMIDSQRNRRKIDDAIFRAVEQEDMLRPYVERHTTRGGIFRVDQ